MSTQCNLVKGDAVAIYIQPLTSLILYNGHILFAHIQHQRACKPATLLHNTSSQTCAGHARTNSKPRRATSVQPRIVAVSAAKVSTCFSTATPSVARHDAHRRDVVGSVLTAYFNMDCVRDLAL